MTDRLVDDPAGVVVLADRVAQDVGIPIDQVIKDFWVTEILRAVVASAHAQRVEVIFKGGTSLSKAFGLIRRFSEDIDVIVRWPTDLTSGAADRVLKQLVAAASTATGIDATTEPGATSSGKKRGARFGYPTSSYASEVDSGIAPGVLLELGSRGGSLPFVRREIGSLIAQHAGEAVAGAPEAERFIAHVLEPHRTLVEKLVLLHTAHSLLGSDADDRDRERQLATARRGARHYYDVHELLGDATIRAELEGCVQTLARDVCLYSRDADMPATDRPGDGFAASPAFTSGPLLSPVADEYHSRVSRLLWPGATLPTFDDCLARIAEHRNLL